MNLLRAFGLGRPLKAGPVESRLTVPFAQGEMEVVLRRHPRARRIKLQIDTVTCLPVLTLPPGVSDVEGLDFLSRNSGWAKRRIDGLPERLVFAPDVIFPFQGRDCRIDHNPTARGGVRLVSDGLIVSGGAEHVSRRVTDYCKAQARATIRPLALDYAARLDRKPGRIIIRDQRTRWGSCSGKGDLSFSWRLILAPPDILDYVTAHEVSHLVHMNHSAAFWRTVATLFPDYRRARDWLGIHGARLHRIG